MCLVFALMTARSVRSVSRLVLVALLLISPLAACNSGDECQSCSSDSDCETGFVCSTFSDDSQRCASGVGATSCNVR
jgi:hypothetical protein